MPYPRNRARPQNDGNAVATADLQRISAWISQGAREQLHLPAVVGHIETGARAKIFDHLFEFLRPRPGTFSSRCFARVEIIGIEVLSQSPGRCLNVDISILDASLRGDRGMKFQCDEALVLRRSAESRALLQVRRRRMPHEERGSASFDTRSAIASVVAGSAPHANTGSCPAETALPDNRALQSADETRSSFPAPGNRRRSSPWGGHGALLRSPPIST